MTTRARTTCEKWCVHSDVELNQLRCSGSSSTATSAERRGTAAPALPRPRGSTEPYDASYLPPYHAIASLDTSKLRRIDNASAPNVRGARPGGTDWRAQGLPPQGVPPYTHVGGGERPPSEGEGQPDGCSFLSPSDTHTHTHTPHT